MSISIIGIEFSQGGVYAPGDKITATVTYTETNFTPQAPKTDTVNVNVSVENQAGLPVDPAHPYDDAEGTGTFTVITDKHKPSPTGVAITDSDARYWVPVGKPELISIDANGVSTWKAVQTTTA